VLEEMGYYSFASTTEIEVAVFHLLMMLLVVTRNSRSQYTLFTTAAFHLLRKLSELAPTRSRGEIDRQIAKKYPSQDGSILPNFNYSHTTTHLASCGYNTTAVHPQPFHLLRELPELASTRSRGKIDEKVTKQC
jgi:hypothetical protein